MYFALAATILVTVSRVRRCPIFGEIWAILMVPYLSQEPLLSSFLILHAFRVRLCFPYSYLFFWILENINTLSKESTNDISI